MSDKDTVEEQDNRILDILQKHGIFTNHTTEIWFDERIHALADELAAHYISKSLVREALTTKTTSELFPDEDIHDFTEETWCHNAALAAQKNMYNQAITELLTKLGLEANE